MRTFRFGPLDRSISSVALGLYPLGHCSQEAGVEMLDTWLGVGGNVVDTAPAYGDGRSECALGDYLRGSGRRSDVVIISKACHPESDGRSRVSPEAISADLSSSLERLDVETIDIYMLHRDDIDVPVGPLIERLNAEIEDGRIRCYGLSNWTKSRIEEAKRYAVRRGLVPASSASAQLSLAEEVVPLAPNVTSIPRAQIRYYQQTGLTVFAWAALAEGWFGCVEQASCESSRFASKPNRERRRRAQELADSLGATPSQVSMAWLLRQHLSVCGIFSSSRPEHIREIADATAIDLSDDVLRWLDLRSDVAPHTARRIG